MELKAEQALCGFRSRGQLEKGIFSPKLQLLSGHSKEKSLAIYPYLALADVSPEYQEAIWMFRSLSWVSYCVPSQLPLC